MTVSRVLADESGAKGFIRGTHRACDPAETYDRFSVHTRTCGITRIANVTGLDTIGLPVFIAIRPNSRGLSTSQGKGLTVAAARVSAMMESFESWHAENITVTGPYARRRDAEALTGIRTIDIRGLNRRGESTEWVDRRRSAWCVGRDLLDGLPTLVPYDSVSTDFTESALALPLVRTTNGLASGNTLLEAELHALYEIIERDAVGLWAAASPDWSAVADPETFDPDNHDLVAAVRAAGLVVAVRAIPSRFDVPVFAATIAPDPARPVPPLATFSGYGAHLDPGVALSRALTEAVQSRLAFISGSRDDLWPSEYARVLDPRAANEWSTRILAAEPSLDFGAVADRSAGTFDEDLDRVRDRFRGRVGSVVSVDLTHADLGIPVVKVVVTGTHGIPFDERRRFGSGPLPGTDFGGTN